MRRREHHGKVALWCTVSLVIALAVAILTALYLTRRGRTGCCRADEPADSAAGRQRKKI